MILSLLVFLGFVLQLKAERESRPGPHLASEVLPGGRVDVAESNDRDVGVRALGDGLVIGPGVGDDQETGLTEGRLDLVSEGT